MRLREPSRSSNARADARAVAEGKDGRVELGVREKVLVEGAHRHHVGIVVIDNCMLDGRVAAPPSPDDDADVVAMRAFNDYFLSHPELDATILPLGDGTGIGARIR